MTLRGEIFTHLGKDEIKMVLESPTLINCFKLSRAVSFILLLALYWLFYNFLSYISCAFKIMMPSTKNIFEIYFSSGFWTLCIYFLVSVIRNNKLAARITD